jgi:hypothetical protein
MINTKLRKGLYKYCKDPYFMELYSNLDDNNKSLLISSIDAFNRLIKIDKNRLCFYYIETIKMINHFDSGNTIAHDVNSYKAYLHLLMKYGADNDNVINLVYNTTNFNQEINIYTQYLKNTIKDYE